MEGGENIFLREELEKRQGKGFNFSALELVGTRDSQQDCVKWIETDDKKFAVGMADGHGKDGAEVSNLVVEIANAELKKFMGTIENDTDANKSDIKELITNQKEQRKDIDTNTADIKELRTFIHSETRQIRERCDRIHKVV